MLRRRFYSSPFESRREIAYAVQGQLHSVPGRTKKYITMAGNDICENAWYIIHGVSRSTYHNYKGRLEEDSAMVVTKIPACRGRGGIPFRRRQI
jgi:hypothetical protein